MSARRLLPVVRFGKPHDESNVVAGTRGVTVEGMADWWLLDEGDQVALAKHINDAAAKVIEKMDNHGNEENITAALGERLSGHVDLKNGTSAEFWYRTLNKQTEEPEVGGDGAFVVSVQTPSGTTRKGVLFQSKLFGDERPTREHVLAKSKAQKFREQLGDMLDQTDEAVGVFYTRENVYVMDAGALHERTANQLKKPISEGRVVTLGTYLGRWVARCTRGDEDSALVRRMQEQGGFAHLLSMHVSTRKPPQLVQSRNNKTWNGPSPQWDVMRTKAKHRRR